LGKGKKISVILCGNIAQCEFYFNKEKNNSQWTNIKYLDLENDKERKIFVTPDNAIYKTSGIFLHDLFEKGTPYLHPLYFIVKKWLKTRIKIC